ncbi:MAG TPA: hypothetical protein VHY91_25795, partial [Pirellulales bacterium]|nr:hypothetical protein [Pirellulales bacterium]
ALRLASSLSKASGNGPLGQLHDARALTTVSTFQLTRLVRLRLTHQMMQIGESFWFSICVGE